MFHLYIVLSTNTNNHGEEAQGEEDVRQGGGGEPHCQAGGDRIPGGAQEEGEGREHQNES